MKNKLLLLVPVLLYLVACSVVSAETQAEYRAIVKKWEKKNMIRYKTFPVFEKIHRLSGEYRGHIADRLKAITDMWLIPAPVANPMMIDMFSTRERERDPVKNEWFSKIGNILPWSGEFVGKHLLSAQLVYRMTHDPELKESIDRLVRRLIATQGDDGYLGPFDKSMRFYNDPSSWQCTWDYWGHYHIMLALLIYYDNTGRCINPRGSRLKVLPVSWFYGGERNP